MPADVTFRRCAARNHACARATDRSARPRRSDPAWSPPGRPAPRPQGAARDCAQTPRSGGPRGRGPIPGARSAPARRSGCSRSKDRRGSPRHRRPERADSGSRLALRSGCAGLLPMPVMRPDRLCGHRFDPRRALKLRCDRAEPDLDDALGALRRRRPVNATPGRQAATPAISPNISKTRSGG